jgi:hypothetical protein
MYCSKCGNQSDESESFCRECGAGFKSTALTPDQQRLPQTASANDITPKSPPRDPDVLIGNGIAGMFAGDGFFVVGVILSATDSSVSSLLWLLLLIPAFVCYGTGLSYLLQARQIRRRAKQSELNITKTNAELPPPRRSVTDLIE